MSSIGITEGGFSRSQSMRMIRTGPHPFITLDVVGPGQELAPGQIAWNPNEDCLDIKQSDGTTVQTGMENHIQVYNHTANTIYNGTVVRFNGVDGDGDETIIAAPIIGDGSVDQQYTLGVITADIPPDGIGRVTWFGKVRDIDTTGDPVEEEWITGDLLYVHPTIIGRLTKVKPTAPDIVVLIGTVLKVDSTSGIIMVKPVIEMQKYYGHFTNTGDIALGTGTSIIPFNLNELSNGIDLDVSNTQITFAKSGLYCINLIAQLYTTNAADKTARFWYRKNGDVIPMSTIAITMDVSSAYRLMSRTDMFSVAAGDYIEVLANSTSTGITIKMAAALGDAPSSPSTSIHINQVQQ